MCVLLQERKCKEAYIRNLCIVRNGTLFITVQRAVGTTYWYCMVHIVGRYTNHQQRNSIPTYDIVAHKHHAHFYLYNRHLTTLGKS